MLALLPFASLVGTLEYIAGLPRLSGVVTIHPVDGCARRAPLRMSCRRHWRSSAWATAESRMLETGGAPEQRRMSFALGSTTLPDSRSPCTTRCQLVHPFLCKFPLLRRCALVLQNLHVMKEYCGGNTATDFSRIPVMELVQHHSLLSRQLTGSGPAIVLDPRRSYPNSVSFD